MPTHYAVVNKARTWMSLAISEHLAEICRTLKGVECCNEGEFEIVGITIVVGEVVPPIPEAELLPLLKQLDQERDARLREGAKRLPKRKK